MLKQIITSPLIASIVGGQIRHIATAAGGALATNGLISGSDVETFGGAAAVLLGMVWSAVQKKLAA